MNKQQLIQEIKDMRNKLASMEKELNKHEQHIQFPRTGDNYFFYLPNGSIEDCYATNDRIKPNAYKTKEEAKEAYNKAVAVEKVNRRILELQGEWCWVFNKLREIPVLRRIICIGNNFKNRFDNEKFTKAVRVGRADSLDEEVGYRFCEPFIGQLPINIREYKKG